MSDYYLGEIRMFPYNFAPSGWQFCSGQLLAISQYQALFSLLGTYYGGNGTSNFALPDFRGRVPNSQGQGPGLADYVLGEASGSEDVTLVTSEIPAHTHQVNVGAAQSTNQPVNGLLAQDGAYTTGTSTGIAATNFLGSAGSNLPHTNIQPYLTVSFCISTVGIYPSRN